MEVFSGKKTGVGFLAPKNIVNKSSPQRPCCWAQKEPSEAPESFLGRNQSITMAGVFIKIVVVVVVVAVVDIGGQNQHV